MVPGNMKTGIPMFVTSFLKKFPGIIDSWECYNFLFYHAFLHLYSHEEGVGK